MLPKEDLDKRGVSAVATWSWLAWLSDLGGGSARACRAWWEDGAVSADPRPLLLWPLPRSVLAACMLLLVPAVFKSMGINKKYKQSQFAQMPLYYSESCF